jgi:hypothetical protein
MAVVVICGFTAVTGVGAIFLRVLSPGYAILVGVQTALMLIVLAIFEYAASRVSRVTEAGEHSSPTKR